MTPAPRPPARTAPLVVIPALLPPVRTTPLAFAVCVALAFALTACPPARTPPPPAPPASWHLPRRDPAPADGPPASAPVEPVPAPGTVPPTGSEYEPAPGAARPTGSEYESTHGLEVSGPIAPYVALRAQQLGVNADRVVTTLFSGEAPRPSPDETTTFISSERYRTGNWTYVTSKSIVLYQLEAIALGAPASRHLLALYARTLPATLTHDNFDARWRLALLDHDYRVRADVEFVTSLRHRVEGMFDMIYADLDVRNRSAKVALTYAHTGGGGGREQGFAASFFVNERPPGLRFQGVAQTKDAWR